MGYYRFMSEITEPLKRLSYRDSSKMLYKFVFGVTLFSILLIVRYQLVHYVDTAPEETVLKLLLSCSVPISILFRLYFWVRPRIYSVYEVYPDHFVRVFHKKREVNPFSEIDKILISLFSPRFLGGFKVVMRNGQKTTFLSALKNSHKLLELIVVARPELVETKTFDNYLQVGRLVDVSWKRMKLKLSQWKLLLAKFVAAPLGLATLAPLISVSEDTIQVINWSEWAIYLVGLSFLLELVLNSIEEKFALKTIAYDEVKDKYTRDLNKEKRIAQLFTGLFGVGMLAGFFVLKQFL